MASVNSVNVLSIDEERLKFRVIAGFNSATAVPTKLGTYVFELPPLTAFGNSQHYKQCIMNCDGMVCYPIAPIEQATWSDGAGAGRVGALEVSLDVPSSGVLANKQFQPVEAGTGTNTIGRFQQLVPLALNIIGNTNGNRTSIVGGADVGVGSSAWQGEGFGEAIMCANPFGSKVEISIRRPDFGGKLHLCAPGALGVDVGAYSFQFTITMVPNH